MKRPEQALHLAVARYLDAVKTSHWEWWHVPNGGYRRKVEAAILKAMGVRAGLPDILIIFAGMAYWIELKAEEGRLSGAQKETHSALDAIGCAVAVARSIEDVQFALACWQIPVRGRLAA